MGTSIGHNHRDHHTQVIEISPKKINQWQCFDDNLEFVLVQYRSQENSPYVVNWLVALGARKERRQCIGTRIIAHRMVQKIYKTLNIFSLNKLKKRPNLYPSIQLNEIYKRYCNNLIFRLKRG